MLARSAELVARAFVAFALVGKFGYNAICFANPIAWFAAIIILIPTLVILMNKLKDIAIAISFFTHVFYLNDYGYFAFLNQVQKLFLHILVILL